MSAKKYEMVDYAERKTYEELARVSKQVIQNANRRLDNLKGNKLLSPAYAVAMREGRFGVGRGNTSKDYNKLLHEYARAIAFLNLETSTVSGAKKYEKTLERMGLKDLTKKQRSVLFEAFRKVENEGYTSVKMYGSTRLINMISEQVRKDKYNILSTMNRDTEEFEEHLNNLVKEMGQLAGDKYEETMKVLNEKNRFEFDIYW